MSQLQRPNLPENRLPAGRVGDAVKWSNLEEGGGVREEAVTRVPKGSD